MAGGREARSTISYRYWNRKGKLASYDFDQLQVFWRAIEKAQCYWL